MVHRLKFGWLVMLVCSVLCASYSIYQAYRTMKDNPIIQSPSLGWTPRWEIPFPAITVCPISKIGSSNFTSNIAYWPDSIRDLLPDNRTDLTHIDISSPSYIEGIFLSRSDQNNYDILTQVLPDMPVPSAMFRSVDSPLEVPGIKMITQYGACVTFNMYPEKNLRRDGVVLSALWNRDTGFSSNLPQLNNTLPLRSFSRTDRLVIWLRVNDTDRLHKFSSKFLVHLHAPDEVPQMNGQTAAITIKSGSRNYIDITPHLVVSEGIEHHQPEIRQCYYYDERHLAFYKGYTQSNCEAECFANYTLAQCKCVHYHLPHFNDTKLCLGSDSCNYLDIGFYSPDFTDDALRSPYEKCHCFPSCTQLLYKPVITEGSPTKFGVINIRHSGLYITKDVRTELHIISEFLSNCGGALGLFLGVSIFSIIELVYFCTVRLYSDIKRRPAANSSE